MRSARSHVHGRVAEVVAVVVASVVDDHVAVVVEVVADLHARRRAGGTAVVDRAVAVIVDRVAADLGAGGTGDGIADVGDRRSCGAGRATVAETGSDTDAAPRFTARATRIGVAGTMVDDALRVTAVGRAEDRARIEVATVATRRVLDDRARLADATVLVREDGVGAAREGHAADDDRDENEQAVVLVHRFSSSTFSPPCARTVVVSVVRCGPFGSTIWVDHGVIKPDGVGTAQL